jgi:hypothetical protein
MLSARFPFALASLLLVTAAVGASCKEETADGTPGKDCAALGGIALAADGDGTTECVEKCDPSKCVENNVCVNNECKRLCETQDECLQALKGDAVNQRCDLVVTDSAKGVLDGDSFSVCVDIDVPLEAGIPCPGGTECDAFGMRCITQGVEDGEAYCANLDCADDSGCLSGYACIPIRVPAGTAGATVTQGPVSLLQNACIKRAPCSPCVTNDDCSESASDLSCITLGTENFCSKSCLSNDDCPSDFSCYTEAGFCLPKSGSCRPPATNNFCYNCVHDLDCSPSGGTAACYNLAAGQKACMDFGGPSCSGNGDCAASPSGRAASCMTPAAWQVDVVGELYNNAIPESDLVNQCFAPFFSSQSAFQCWPFN